MRPFILSAWIVMALSVSACSDRTPELITEPGPSASPAAEEDAVPPREEIAPEAEEEIIEALKEESEVARFAVDDVQEARADQPEEPAAEITSAETPVEPSNEQPSLSTNDVPDTEEEPAGIANTVVTAVNPGPVYVNGRRPYTANNGLSATAEPYTPPQDYESPGLSATWTAPEQKPGLRFKGRLIDCEQLGLVDCP
jgi:hypothetical protein